MDPQIIVSVHAPVQIPKPHKIGLGNVVSKAGVSFGVLNNIKGQIIQGKTTIRGTELNLNLFCEWLWALKHVKNERT